MSKLKYLFTLIGIAAALIVIIELILRIAFSYPRHTFDFVLSGKDGLYPPNSTIVMKFGFRPYTVKTNSLGMRSEEVSVIKPQGVTRIMAIGDSITDGFFVSNKKTYPSQLEEKLRAFGCKVEVLNASRGGGSIDKEYALLKANIYLKPDIVLLSFVTNDIYELRGRNPQDLITRKAVSAYMNVIKFLLTRTATGEFFADLALRLRYANYRLFDRAGYAGNSRAKAQARPTDYDRNLNIFEKAEGPTELDILKHLSTPKTKKALDGYIFALDNMKNFCSQNDAELVLIYVPNYYQIYGESPLIELRDVLRSACMKSGIRFLDLTEAFRTAGKTEPFHFAPYDFHLNEAGYGLYSGIIATYLVKEGLVKKIYN